MKNNTTIYIVSIALIALIVGIFAGYFIWDRQSTGMNTSSMHTMPNGMVMSDTGSDMSSMMDSMNADLVGKSGDTFDRVFLSEMIVHHQGAVEMAQLALTNAKHQEIKTLAEEIIGAQNKEIAEMKQWQKDWYNQ